MNLYYSNDDTDYAPSTPHLYFYTLIINAWEHTRTHIDNIRDPKNYGERCISKKRNTQNILLSRLRARANQSPYFTNEQYDRRIFIAFRSVTKYIKIYKIFKCSNSTVARISPWFEKISIKQMRMQNASYFSEYKFHIRVNVDSIVQRNKTSGFGEMYND